MVVPWYIFAFSAAIVWGLMYVLEEKVLGHISPATLMFFHGILIIPFTLIFSKTIFPEISTLIENKNWSIIALGVFCGLLGVVAAYFMFLSIMTKNAVMAGMIEISYPLFIVFFSALILGTTSLSLYTLVGALLILSGSFLVVWKG